jgi:phospholipid-binding lipoprotein MlaA
MEGKKMNGKKICGIVLVAGVLLAGSAWAEEQPDQGLENRTSGQVSMGNETTILSDVTLSEPVDGAASEKGAADKEEAVPKADVSPKSEAVEEDADTDEAAGEDADTGENVEEVTIADPIEPLNRAVFLFNDKFYFWAYKPVARGYNAIVPEPVRISVRNFFRNVEMPIRFVNSLFQGKFKGAGTELARFGINTTLGAAGFFDPAKSKFDLSPQDEDLGQTLGFYGMGGLMYIVWPILGPSTLRDTIGMAGDTFLSPVSYITPFEVAFGVSAYEQFNNTSLVLGSYEKMKEALLEPYIGVRNAYLQHRKELIDK